MNSNTSNIPNTKDKVNKILMVTAFPTYGAGSGVQVTALAKSYQKEGKDVAIITGNNRTEFDKIPGVKYHMVPFTSEEEKGWGYGKQVANEDEFIQRFELLTKNIKEIPYISGYCYTQLTDVQQEINGLVDENRNSKFSKKVEDKIKEVN